MICISGKFECFPEEMIILSCGKSSFPVEIHHFPVEIHHFFRKLNGNEKMGIFFPFLGVRFPAKLTVGALPG